MSTEPRTDDKLSFIMYEDTNLPRYYEVSRNTFKTLIYGIPMILLIAIAVVFLSVTYIRKIKLDIKQNDPNLVRKFKLANLQFMKKTKDLQRANRDLMKRLLLNTKRAAVVPPVEITKQEKQKVEVPWQLFKHIPGQKNILSKSYLQVQSHKITQTEENLSLKFDLVNTSREKIRMSGFLHVILQINNQLIVWPRGSLDSDSLQITYNSGESFATSKFRPVGATFPLTVPQVGEHRKQELTFWVVAHNITGDLLHRQIIRESIELKSNDTTD